MLYAMSDMWYTTSDMRYATWTRHMRHVICDTWYAMCKLASYHIFLHQRLLLKKLCTYHYGGWKEAWTSGFGRVAQSLFQCERQTVQVICIAICIALFGKSPYRQVTMDTMIASGNIGHVMVRTLAPKMTRIAFEFCPVNSVSYFHHHQWHWVLSLPSCPSYVVYSCCSFPVWTYKWIACRYAILSTEWFLYGYQLGRVKLGLLLCACVCVSKSNLYCCSAVSLCLR